MPICTLTENEIVRGLLSEEEHVRQRTSLCIYKDDEINRSVKGYVQKRGGTLQQANEVFDYAFLRFDIRVQCGLYPDPRIPENDWRKTLGVIGYKAWDYKEYGQIKLRTLDEWKETYDPIAPLSESDFQIDLHDLLNLFPQCGPQCSFIFDKLMQGYKQNEIAEMLTEALGKTVSHENLRQMVGACRRELSRRISSLT